MIQLEIDIPKDTIMKFWSMAREFRLAWNWFTVDTLMRAKGYEDWHVSNDDDQQGPIKIDNGQTRWVFRSLVIAREGKPPERSMYSSDEVPMLVQFLREINSFENRGNRMLHTNILTNNCTPVTRKETA